MSVAETIPALYQVPCEKYMRDYLDAGSVDVIVTSPPYNLGIRYNEHDDSMPMDEYLKWMRDVFEGMYDVLADDGSVFVNLGFSSKQPWIAFDVINESREMFHMQNQIVWVKSHTTEYKDGEEKSFGHFKPINSKRYTNNNFEYVFHLTKNPKVEIDRLSIGVDYVDKSNISRWSSSRNKRCRGNVWCIPYETITRGGERGNHPATFPTKLAEWCIRLHGINDDKKLMVFDPFMGSGSTLVAATNLGQNVVGCDIDIDYLRFASSRVDNCIVMAK